MIYIICDWSKKVRQSPVRYHFMKFMYSKIHSRFPLTEQKSQPLQIITFKYVPGDLKNKNLEMMASCNSLNPEYG